jgi:hypothetical protein
MSVSPAKVAVIQITFTEGVAAADVHIENASAAHLYAAAGLIHYEADKARTGIDFANLQEDRIKRMIQADPTGGIIGGNGKRP